MIDLTMNRKQMEKNAKHCKSKGIILPTFEQMKNPDSIPQNIKDELKNIGLWDIHPKNLFRITWKNEPIAKGGMYGKSNYMVLPPELTGCKAKIIALCGKQSGFSFGICLVVNLNPHKLREMNSIFIVCNKVNNYHKG